MDRTFTVLHSSGQGVVTVIFNQPVVEERVVVNMEYISDFDKDSVTREVYLVIRDLKDSGLVSKIDWHPQRGLSMTLRSGVRRDWLISRLEGILSHIAIKARETQNAGR